MIIINPKIADGRLLNFSAVALLSLTEQYSKSTEVDIDP